MWRDSERRVWIFGGSSYAHDSHPHLFTNDMWMYDPLDDSWETIYNQTDIIWEASTFNEGLKGSFSNETRPGSRNGPTAWTSVSGRKLWLFGGETCNPDRTAKIYVNDLWMYDVDLRLWAWMGGSPDHTDYNGVAGAEGQASPDFIPSARSHMASCTCSDGIAWLFGGDNAGNELWRFDELSLNWTLVRSAGPTEYGTRGVPDESNRPDSGSGPRMSCDMDGNLWLFGGRNYPNENNALWCFSSGVWTWMKGEKDDSSTTMGPLGVANPSFSPEGRQFHAVAVDNRNLFFTFGGTFFEGYGLCDDVWMINLDNSTRPLAHEQTVTTNEDELVVITLNATHGVEEPSPFSFFISELPLQSTGALFQFSGVKGDPVARGDKIIDPSARVAFVPAPNLNGQDAAEFIFFASSSDLSTIPAVVRVDIIPVNDAPVALNQSQNMYEDFRFTVVLEGDDTTDAGTITAINITTLPNPAHGSLRDANSDNSIHFHQARTK